MHVIIFQQQVIDLISFYKFFNDTYFTHVIFLLGSTHVIFLWGQMSVVTSKIKSGYHRTTHEKWKKERTTGG